MVVDEGGPKDTRSIPLATKRGYYIRNIQPPERAPESMSVAERTWKSSRPSIETRSLSATYNCFGLVFASRRTYVLDDQVETILEHDGYRPVRNMADLRLGDLVVYRQEAGGTITHIGVVIEIGKPFL